MFYTACRILKDEKDSEDVVHDAFVKIIGIIEKIDEPVCPQTRKLIVTITENRAIDLYRKRKKLSAEAAEDLPDLFISTPEEKLVFDSCIIEAIATLPPVQREILILRYEYGYSVKEISKIVSKSPEAVKKIIQRSKKKLSGVLKEE